MENLNDPLAIQQCVFCPEAKSIQTTMKLRSTLEPTYVGPDEWVCIYSRMTLREMIDAGAVSGRAVMVSYRDGIRMYDDAMRELYCKGPKLISKERWMDMLEVLPPERWEKVPGGEVFMMPECIAASVYTFGVRIGNRFFRINESYQKSSRDIAEQCCEFIDGMQSSANCRA